MQLVLNTFGTGLNKSGQMFEIFSDGKKHKISPLKVSSILISPGINISSDAVQLALQNNIDIYIMDKFGNPVGRFWHARMGSTTRIRRAQLLLSMSEDGIEFGLRWVIAKFENQIEFLKEMRSRRTRLSAEITSAIENLQNSREKLIELTGNMNDIRQNVLGIEGSGGKVYWDIFSKLVPEQFVFSGRSRRPAKDEFNAILNYGYGVLYGMVERAVVVAGLDPYIGFIHTDNYNKVSLVFDVIEKYRIWIEQSILGLFSKKMLKKNMFDKLANGYNIGDEGKKVLIPAINEFLDQQVRYNNRNIRRRDVIQLDLHAFAQELLGAGGS
jgi:CRISPR-associated protein Cas1